MYVSNARLIAYRTTELSECDTGCDVYDYGNKAWVFDVSKRVNVLVDECVADEQAADHDKEQRMQVRERSRSLSEKTSNALDSGEIILRPKFTTIAILFIVMVLIEVYLG